MVMADKVIIVTGANCSIGLEVTKRLCELGHDVVISTRDDAKGEETLRVIRSHVKEAKISYIPMELSDPASVRKFVDRFHSSGKKLNILINNAGLFQEFRGTKRTIARGDPTLEITMTVNCMGPFLLTNLLLADLKATATEDTPSRVVNVSSGITVNGKKMGAGDFDINDIMLEKEGAYLNGVTSYRNSKLALNLWSNELAEKLKTSHVTVNTLCPGFIPSTGLKRDNPDKWTSSLLYGFLDSFIGRKIVGTKPVSAGRDSVLKVALEEKITNTTGVFFMEDKPTPEAPEVMDSENRSRIWDICTNYTGLQ